MKATEQIPVRISEEDLKVITSIAESERRRQTDVIRNLLEDLADNKIAIEQPDTGKKVMTAVRVTEQFKAKIEAMKERRGLSVERALHLAIQSIRAEMSVEKDAHIALEKIRSNDAHR